MAGTLTISTLSDGTNSTSSTNCIQGSAKAWANFDGTNGTIRASYNISSVTRTSTGLFTVSFTNAMIDNKYAIAGMGRLNSGVTNAGYVVAVNTSDGSANITTTSFKLVTVQQNGTEADGQYVGVTVFR